MLQLAFHNEKGLIKNDFTVDEIPDDTYISSTVWENITDRLNLVEENITEIIGLDTVNENVLVAKPVHNKLTKYSTYMLFEYSNMGEIAHIIDIIDNKNIVITTCTGNTIKGVDITDEEISFLLDTYVMNKYIHNKIRNRINENIPCTIKWSGEIINNKFKNDGRN